MPHVSIALNETKTKATVEFLNGYLADLHIVFSKLHSYHWNVEDRMFFGLHAKLEEFYDAVSEEIDGIAERTLMLGGRPLSTFREYLDRSSLKEAPARAYGGTEIGKSVLEDFTFLIGRLREGIRTADEADDQGTVDLLTGSLRFYEKALWMLRSFLG